MMKNDLNFVLPCQNGVRVCTLAIKELSHFAVDVINKMKEEQQASPAKDNAADNSKVLEEIYKQVKGAEEVLEFCKNDEGELPPALDLSGPEDPSDADDPAMTQFMDHPVWDVINTESDPGQAVALQKYIPIDLLTVRLLCCGCQSVIFF